MPWRDVPPKWWAVMVGVSFGALALVYIDGPKKGWGRAVIGAFMTSPLLALIAGGLLPEDTSLEIAALIGGVVALGGTALLLAIGKMIPPLVTAGLTGMAQSYLHISAPREDGKTEVTRIRTDGTPKEPDPEAEELARRIDGKDDDNDHD